MSPKNQAVRYRCSLRGGLKGSFDPAGAKVSIPVWDGSASYPRSVVWIHELVHRDLTEPTISGWLERVLAIAVDHEPIASSTRQALRETYDRLFDNAFNVHEGTATFVSGIYYEGSAEKPEFDPWANLPASYENALGIILRVFPGRKNASSKAARLAEQGRDARQRRPHGLQRLDWTCLAGEDEQDLNGCIGGQHGDQRVIDDRHSARRVSCQTTNHRPHRLSPDRNC